MSKANAVRIVASWLFIAGVAWLAWHYAPAILLIVATATALAMAFALFSVLILAMRARRQ